MGLRYLCLLTLLATAGCTRPDASPHITPQGSPYVSAASSLALVGGTLIDGTGRPPVENATVLIADGEIVAAGTRDAVTIPAGARIVDVTGDTVLPGFINAHVHDAYDVGRLETWARAGVTTVRDEGILGSTTLSQALSLRDSLAGYPRYARLISAGHMLGPPAGYGRRAVASEVEATRIVNEELDDGVDLVKFSAEDGYAGRAGLPIFDQDVMDALVAAAHARGARVSVHVCDARYLDAVLDAGVDDIAHIQYDVVSDDLIRRMVDQDVYIVPTLTVLEAYGALAGSQANLRRYVEAGVQIALGNDYTAVPQNSFDHFELGMPMHEIRRMHEAGMTAMEIILAATRNAAHVCGLESELGTLEAGKAADVLVVGGDPLADLEVLLDVRYVLHGGEIIVGADTAAEELPGGREDSEETKMGPFANISGLNKLAEAYSASQAPADLPSGARWTVQTIGVGTIRYRNCVDVAVSAEGLYLWVRPPLLTKARLLIPWDDIVATQPARLYSRPAVRLVIGDPEVGTIRLYRELYEAILPLSGLPGGGG